MHEEGNNQTYRRNTIMIIAAVIILAGILIALAIQFIVRPGNGATDNPDPTAEPLAADENGGFAVILHGRVAVADGAEPNPWEEGTLQVHPGDTLEIQAGYVNLDMLTHDGVCMGFYLPGDTEYLPGSALLLNASHPNGASVEDTVVDYGINIGNYAGKSTADTDGQTGANAYVRISLQVPENITKVSTPVEIWVKAGMPGEEATILFGEITLEVISDSSTTI